MVTCIQLGPRSPTGLSSPFLPPETRKYGLYLDEYISDMFPRSLKVSKWQKVIKMARSFLKMYIYRAEQEFKILGFSSKSSKKRKIRVLSLEEACLVNLRETFRPSWPPSSEILFPMKEIIKKKKQKNLNIVSASV